MKKVLYADDSRTSQTLVERFLAKMGYVVFTVPDGKRAVEQARENAFSCILMDMRMPVMDGVTATREIRTLPSPRGDVPIIGLTAGTEAEVRACINGGMDLVLGKPIDFEQLVEALAALSGSGAVAPVAPKAQKTFAPGNAPINLPRLTALVADIGRPTMRSALDTFREEAPAQIGAIALAAARKRHDVVENTLFNLRSSADMFAGEQLCRIIDSISGGVAGRDLFERDFRTLAEATGLLVELLDQALAAPPTR